MSITTESKPIEDAETMEAFYLWYRAHAAEYRDEEEARATFLRLTRDG